MSNTKIIYHVDAFTSEPFKGNPAGVMITENELESAMMQLIAAEMNLSETAFLNRIEGGYRIRYYTPESEIELCGHATLSSAHILYETGQVEPSRQIKLFSKAGELFIKRSGNMIIMNFPTYTLQKIEIPDAFMDAIGFRAMELYECDYGWKLALLEYEEDVRSVAPDSGALKKAGLGSLIITAPGNSPDYDFVVRCFVPELGITEDPVTGSAHCALTPFWSGKTGRSEFRSLQVSKRTGRLEVKLKDDRVEISGEAITVMKATLLI
ncbi:MAG TPA: PhzF family phenazine biosynthesis protein [Bacteroidales bacterium]|nr:PhzF family phenazine biosynthesis protein [Bacteroidales bacterium]